MELKPGSRWKSAVCDAQLVVVRPPSAAGELQCGGVAVLPIDDPAAPSGDVSADFAEGVLIGKGEAVTAALPEPPLTPTLEAARSAGARYAGLGQRFHEDAPPAGVALRHLLQAGRNQSMEVVGHRPHHTPGVLLFWESFSF